MPGSISSSILLSDCILIVGTKPAMNQLSSPAEFITREIESLQVAQGTYFNSTSCMATRADQVVYVLRTRRIRSTVQQLSQGSNLSPWRFICYRFRYASRLTQQGETCCTRTDVLYSVCTALQLKECSSIIAGSGILWDLSDHHSIR